MRKRDVDTRKPDTIIRELRRLAAEAQNRATEHANAKRTAETELLRVRGKLTQAEQSAAEWRTRFDTLLSRVPLAPLRPDFESTNPLCDAPLCMRDRGHMGPHVMYSVQQLNADGTALRSAGQAVPESAPRLAVNVDPGVRCRSRNGTADPRDHSQCVRRYNHPGPHMFPADGPQCATFDSTFIGARRQCVLVHGHAGPHDYEPRDTIAHHPV